MTDTDAVLPGAEPGAASPFERDTSVTAAGDGLWSARCEERWFAPRGPNGGYLAAMVLRAMTEAVADAARSPRSLTLHYARPPAGGPVEISVTVEREGRRLSTVAARLEQSGRLCVLALGAFATDFPSVLDYTPPAPVMVPEAEIEPLPAHPALPPFAQRLVMRPAIGPPPFGGGDEARTGGWMRFADGPQAIDAPALALLVDAWLPAPFTRLTAPVGVPTIDLTIHFRAPEARLDEPVLGVFTSRCSHGGFCEEDAELWSADGRLLAQGRQLALLVS